MLLTLDEPDRERALQNSAVYKEDAKKQFNIFFERHLGPLSLEKHIEIRHEIPGNLPILESDEIRVSQILQNVMEWKPG